MKNDMEFLVKNDEVCLVEKGTGKVIEKFGLNTTKRSVDKLQGIIKRLAERRERIKQNE